jgi:multidrug efflux system outer membrane protein
MLKHSLIAAAVAMLAAGCTLQPKYERPAEPTSQTFPEGGVYAHQPDASSTASNGRSADGKIAPDIGWRDFFADPRLQKIVELALKNNRDLRVSVLNIEAARAQYQITRAALFPTLNATASQTKQRTPKDLSFFGQTISNEYSVGLNASWEIDFFGRIRSLKDQALAQYLSTAESRKAAEIALVSSVADQYVTILAYDDALTVTENTLKTALESYRITKLQYDNGTGTELDLRQSEGVVEEARANLQTQSRLRAQAENALVQLVGEPLPADLPTGADADRGQREHRRGARGVLPARLADGQLRHAFADARRPVQAGLGCVVVRAADHGADLRGRRESGQPRSGERAEAHRDRQL